jgi:hypothetical protein
MKPRKRRTSANSPAIPLVQLLEEERRQRAARIAAQAGAEYAAHVEGELLQGLDWCEKL